MPFWELGLGLVALGINLVWLYVWHEGINGVCVLVSGFIMIFVRCKFAL